MIANLNQGVFKKRYKRFFADVETQDQQQLTLHCPNTGAMTGLLQEGVQALFSLATPEELKKRKTPGTLEALQVLFNDRYYWVGVNTHRANQIARRWFEQPEIMQELNIESIQQEVKLAKLLLLKPISKSQPQETSEAGQEEPTPMKTRVDFMLNRINQKPLLVEVKSATLLEAGEKSGKAEHKGYFPDAVSTRATAQLKDLLTMQTFGYDIMVLYVSQHEGISQVEPATHIDPKYAEIVAIAKEKGVKFRTLAFDTGFYGL